MIQCIHTIHMHNTCVQGKQLWKLVNGKLCSVSPTFNLEFKSKMFAAVLISLNPSLSVPRLQWEFFSRLMVFMTLMLLTVMREGLGWGTSDSIPTQSVCIASQDWESHKQDIPSSQPVLSYSDPLGTGFMSKTVNMFLFKRFVKNWIVGVVLRKVVEYLSSSWGITVPWLLAQVFCTTQAKLASSLSALGAFGLAFVGCCCGLLLGFFCLGFFVYL